MYLVFLIYGGFTPAYMLSALWAYLGCLQKLSPAIISEHTIDINITTCIAQKPA